MQSTEIILSRYNSWHDQTQQQKDQVYHKSSHKKESEYKKSQKSNQNYKNQRTQREYMLSQKEIKIITETPQVELHSLKHLNELFFWHIIPD